MLSTSFAQHQLRIDSLMEQASRDLVRRKYFEVEEVCREALRKAHAIRDYDRIARILMPLQEARRQKRDLAIDSGRVVVVEAQLPTDLELAAGCYLIVPPRVGVDGRALREIADQKRVPVVVIVREPTTLDGLWPVVSVGLSTVRTKVKPPAPVSAAPVAKPRPVRKTSKKTAAETAVVAPRTQPSGEAVPPPKWFIAAAEALGDAAIASMPPDAHPTIRVERLIALLEGLPDHEKLHQALETAARAAARDPRPPRRLTPIFLEDDDGLGLATTLN